MSCVSFISVYISDLQFSFFYKKAAQKTNWSKNTAKEQYNVSLAHFVHNQQAE